MPVNLSVPDPNALHPVPGVQLGVAQAAIRKQGRKDLLLVRIDPDSRVAGVFTKNRFCAAPVVLCREHLERVGGSVRALVINTGCANAGTGDPGMIAARTTCEAVAAALGCLPVEVLPFSTGVIMEPLPVDRIVAGLPECVSNFSADDWAGAAESIMTTDTLPKAYSVRYSSGGAQVTITGIAKGAGMIHPNMATMLGFVASDARVSPDLVRKAVAYAADRSFNCITVDGDTSTNDSFILIATGRAEMSEITDESSAEYAAFRDEVTAVATRLAQAIIRDGEGATKFMTITVGGGKTDDECRKVAFAVAHAPLVKTAFFASDPNLGRILAAIGYAGIDDLDVDRVELYLDDIKVAANGGRDPAYTEEQGQRVMKQAEITVRVMLNRGTATATVWTCDFSHDYVSINADYRS